MPWDAVNAIATCVTALGVVLAFYQILLTRSLAQLQFEDSLAREYRSICATIPAAMFFRREYTDAQYHKTLDEFYRYIDLSNEQVSLRQHNRVTTAVWRNWCSGIEQNLALPAFERAWNEIKANTISFGELRTLEASDFKDDPKNWPRNKN